MKPPKKAATQNDMQQGADFKIARDGTWYHEDSPIKRDALAKLFADRALKIDENGSYWLQTPYERYPVEVEDVPFVIVDYHEKQDSIIFKTNTDEDVMLGKTRWEVRDGIPYIEVRDGLFARMGRSVYYNLIEHYGSQIQGFPLGDA